MRRGAQTLFVLVALIGVGLYWAQGRSFAAPEWVRVEIEQRANAQLSDAQMGIGEAVVVLENGWRPSFRIRDLEMRTSEGNEIVTFSQVGGGLDLEALSEGQIALTSLMVDGVFVTLRRGASGGVSVTTGAVSGNAVTQQASNVSQLIANLDELLLRPGLASLTDAQVRGVTLRYEDERSGRAWTIDGGRFRLARNGTSLDLSADLAVLGGGAHVATLEVNYSGVIGAIASDFGISFSDVASRDIASQSPAFAWLGALDAPISGSLRGGLTETGTLKPLNATFEVYNGAIQPQPEAKPIPLSVARSYFTYLPEQQTVRFDEFYVESAWGSGYFEGSAQLGADAMVGQFRSGKLTANPIGIYDEPVSVEAAEIDFRMSYAPFVLDVGRLDVVDQGNVLSGRGKLAVGDAGWDLAFDMAMDAISPTRLLELWPDNGIGFKTRKWITENVFAASLSAIEGAVRIVQGKAPNLYVGFDFDEAEFRFMRAMPPLQNGKGYATLIDNRFVAVLDEGGVEAPQGGYVEAKGSSFIIPDVKAKPDPPGVVRLNAAGPLVAALSLLDRPPLEIMTKANRPVDLAEGQVQLAGTLSFPLRKGNKIDAVDFDIAGHVSEVSSDKLVDGRSVRSDRLSLIVSDEEVDLSGPVTLDGVPARMRWQKVLGSPDQKGRSRITGDIDLTAEALDALNITLPPRSVSGSGKADFSVQLEQDAPPVLELSSELEGLELSIPQINWRKAASSSGSLNVVAKLSSVPEVERIALDAPGLSAEGNLSLSGGGKMDRLRMESVQVANWFNGAVDLVGRGAGRAPGVVIRGGVLDMRQADFGQSTSGGSAPLTVRLDRLQVSDTIAITAMSGQFTTGGTLRGTFEGAVNGAARISGELVPQGARSAINLSSSDAGSVFASAGLTRQARGGELQLQLNPVGSGGAFDGKLRVDDARIKDAPAIAALLNSLSIVGLVDELAGEGIYFSEINADFRMSPSQITLREASAVGPSMGLSMDGLYVPDSGKIEIQGVISPIYLVNAVGSLLTREGEGLFGFNYSITGTAAEPNVFVNPLTALAPAMFRNLFRRAAPDVPLEEGEEPPPPPPPKLTLEERREQR